MSKARVLSTKKLTPSQRHLLLNADISVVEHAFIKIEPILFEIKQLHRNIIFTSQNAVKSVLKQRSAQELKDKYIFCVGEKTKLKLIEKGLKIIENAQNSFDLAQKIIKKHKNRPFSFFCGNLKREELPQVLKQNKIAYNEIEVYKTILSPKKVKGVFDGVLFFSPSGVESYMQDNEIGISIAFCIGETTASELKKYTNNIVIANTPSIENVIVQAIKHFS
ncbi:uroporphyrinogen-III synthase [Leptobacterium sp. I13]|uniref:uroporphyrinogen-III synthase n=1 Tax=Leptobacterium meishanense TaxID=3128904 RepID=UPI0030EBE338